MPKTIRLMTDYGCYPLWVEEPDEMGDIDPATLPISQEIIKRLDEWRKAYEEILNWSYPAASGFPSIQAREAFNREGVTLWLQLRNYLWPDYEVVYFSEILQKNIDHPKELEALLSISYAS